MSTERPFRVLGLQQIAIGGLDLGALRRLWVDTLGVEKAGEYTSESENVQEDILRLGAGEHAVEIDLMQPLDPESRPKSRTNSARGQRKTRWRRRKRASTLMR